MKRRAFVKLAASAVALSPVHRLALASRSSPLPEASVATLRSLAPVVLPTALGRRGVDRVTERFLDWLGGYRAGVVMQHGYGHPRVRPTPESPAPRYIEQLRALVEAADRQDHQAFSRLSPEAKLGLIEAAFEAAKVDELPRLPNGRHVVADLMAFYFRSTEANDDCYRAAIGWQTCRPLSQVTTRPRPLV